MTDLNKILNEFEAEFDAATKMIIVPRFAPKALKLTKALMIAIHDISLFKHTSTDENTKERARGCIEDIEKILKEKE